MIPTVKESNNFKAFLGINLHLPEFYDETIDKLNQASEKKSQYITSVNLKDFTDKAVNERNKSELFKYITGPKHGTSMEKQHQNQSIISNSNTKSRSNLRYQVLKENDLNDSPDKPTIKQPKMIPYSEKKNTGMDTKIGVHEYVLQPEHPGTRESLISSTTQVMN
jgi:hypothetical protein